MSESGGKDGDIVIIKKYANRRLYNTRSSSYITLDHLAKMTREGVEFQVLDAKTGTDITHQILTQIIMEEEASGGEQNTKVDQSPPAAATPDAVPPKAAQRVRDSGATLLSFNGRPEILSNGPEFNSSPWMIAV